MRPSMLKYLILLLYIATIFLTFYVHVDWPRLAVPFLAAVGTLAVGLYPSGQRPTTPAIIAVLLLLSAFVIDLWTTIFLGSKWNAGLYIGIIALGFFSWLITIVGLLIVPTSTFAKLLRWG